MFYLYHSQSLIYHTTAIVHLLHIRSSLFRILTVVVTIKCARNAHSNAQYIPVRGYPNFVSIDIYNCIPHEIMHMKYEKKRKKRDICLIIGVNFNAEYRQLFIFD